MIAYPFGVGKVRTRVLEAGTGPRALIFLHGLGARADRWRENLDALAATGYHCYAFDLPGHGFADKLADFPYGVPGYAGFVAEFTERLGGAGHLPYLERPGQFDAAVLDFLRHSWK